METQRTICRASVWPHRHTNELCGPVNVVVSYRNQPSIVQRYIPEISARVRLEQPDERTNLTVMKLILNLPHLDREKWYNVKHTRNRKTNGLKFYIKSRVTRQMKHPIPWGKWQGTCEYTDKWCLFTFQAMTMKVKPEEPLIVLPDGLLPENKTRIVLP